MWRNTALSARFFFLDSSSLVFFFIWGLHMSWPTFWISVGGSIFLTLLVYFGLTPITLARRLRAMMARGNRSEDYQTAALQRFFEK